MIPHAQDEDCTVGEDGCCVICQVDHSGGCPWCEGQGFHRPGCIYYREEE